MSNNQTKIKSCILFLIYSALIFIVGCENNKHQYNFSISDWKTIVEGKGIDSLAFIGNNINQVQQKWGTADHESKESSTIFLPDKYYYYYKRGVEFRCNWYGEIKFIAVYFKRDDTLSFPVSGHPSAIYETFDGKTKKGLVLHAGLTQEEVVKVYGKPEVKEMVPNCSMLVYQSDGISFMQFADKIERLEISQSK